MKRVLLTGAAGFVGSHCISPLLDHGFEIHAVTTRPIDQANQRVVWHQADLLDHSQTESLLRQVAPSHLLHLAWFVTPGEYWTSPLNFRWVEASLVLLQAFAAVGGSRAVFVGTGAEYDPFAETCVEATTPLRPTTIYGACKASLSLLLRAYAPQLGISSAWARLFYLYGPHERPQRLVPSAVRALLANQPFDCTPGEQIRDYLYVQDAADALAALLDSEVVNEVNVASGQGVALKTIVSTIGEQLERPHLLRFGAKPTPPNEPPIQIADVTRLSREVGWLPRVPLQEGIHRSIDWWQQHG